MRGKDHRSNHSRTCTRITPAYAGKRDREIVAVFIVWDHPRLCGEKKHYHGLIDDWVGSPPPMRGKVQRFHHHHFLPGITPAYAGKSHGR